MMKTCVYFKMAVFLLRRREVKQFRHCLSSVSVDQWRCMNVNLVNKSEKILNCGKLILGRSDQIALMGFGDRGATRVLTHL